MVNSLYIFIKYLKTFSVDLWWFFIDSAKFLALRKEEGMVENNNKIWQVFMKLLRSQWCLGTVSKILFLKCFIFLPNLLICVFSCILQFLSSVTLQVSWCPLPVQASYKQVREVFTHTVFISTVHICSSEDFLAPCPVFMAVLFHHRGHCSLLVFTSFYLGLTCVSVTILLSCM